MSSPVRILELRSVRGTGGGPDKTILLGAHLADPARFKTTVCYVRNRHDPEFRVTDRVGRDIDYLELLESHPFDLRVWRALRRLVIERQIDIIHAHDYKTDLWAWSLAKATKALPLATAHGWTGHSARERFVYYPCDKRLLARFPRVIAVSDEIRRTLIRTGTHPGRVTTILNGIDPAAFRRDAAGGDGTRRQLGFAAGDIVVGSVGRLEPQKRFDILLEAFALLRSRRADLKLAIAGEGSARTALERRRDELQLGASCVFVGHVEDVRPMYGACDLFVQSSDYEGTPNTVLEGMALEVPIVATDAGGTRELITDGVHGLIVRPGDSRALSDAMEAVVADSSLGHRLARAARRRIETELSFAARMRRVESLYEELVA
jgi:glycosyltransferase involved in cell wall biosynthesis